MLADRIRDKTAVIGVMGLGYVGLSLAVAFAEAWFNVVGFDVQPSKVWSVSRGESYIPDVNEDCLRVLVRSHRLRAITNPPNPWLVDVVIICVPTPITKAKRPDLSYIEDALELLRTHIQSTDTLVVLESSTYPGTTRELVQTGLKDIARYIAYSPERVDPGNKKYSIRNTPKLIGGIDAESTRLATALYSNIVDGVVVVSSPETAEMVKLFENVFRNVNIALVNEMALLCEKMGISIWEVIGAATTKPFGFIPFYPGLGAGGHCIPVDPYYIVDKAREYNFRTSLVDLALGINESMPEHVAHRVIDIISGTGKSIRGAKVMVMGVAFKRDVEDTRGSPSLILMQILLDKGADVSYNDPYVPKVTVGKRSMVSSPLDDIGNADCVVIATDHSCYDYQHIADTACLVYDTKGVTRNIQGSNIVRLGEKEC